MSHWKVRVDCQREGVTHPVIRRFLIEADNSFDALRVGEAHAENTADSSKWIEFKAREAAHVTLPLELT